MTVAEIAEKVGGEYRGDGATVIRGITAANHAAAGDLTFAENAARFAEAEASAATAVLAPPGFTSGHKLLICVKNPRIAMAQLLPIFFPPEPHVSGVDPSAKISSSAEVHPTARIGPWCLIGDRVKIGARSVLMAGNHLGSDTTVGEDVRLFPHVILYSSTVVGNRVTIHAGTVIGSDGYGYVFDEDRHRKVLQVGNVVIHDDVEIGANSAIDRAALHSTIIGAGTKIDNLVHIAHGVVTGRHCLILGQAGFAGGTHLGDHVIIAAQAGIAGHLKIGSQAIVAAKSGVMRDIPPGGRVFGFPAQPDQKMKRQIVASQQLPEMLKRVRELEKIVEKLTNGVSPPVSQA
jgi:UDP-3-O-[3-hydroxymyristoyl] glucosamine N-acyltransferase